MLPLRVGGFQPAQLHFPKMGGPQYRLQNTTILILGTPQEGTADFGKPTKEARCPSLRVWVLLFPAIAAETTCFRCRDAT